MSQDHFEDCRSFKDFQESRNFDAFYEAQGQAAVDREERECQEYDPNAEAESPMPLYDEEPDVGPDGEEIAARAYEREMEGETR